MSAANLDAWGWRIPFFVGAVLAASVWIARTTMEESPDFERQQASGTVPTRPLLYALTNHRAGILRAFAISALGSITYYVGITYVPHSWFPPESSARATRFGCPPLAAVAVIVVTPFAGALSDRLGRKPVLIFLDLCSAILPVTLFPLMAGGSPSSLCSGPSFSLASPALSAPSAPSDRRTVPGRRPHQRAGAWGRPQPPRSSAAPRLMSLRF